MSWSDEKIIMKYAHLGAKIKDLDKIIVDIYEILEKNKVPLEETANLFSVIEDVQNVGIMGFGMIYVEIEKRTRKTI